MSEYTDLIQKEKEEALRDFNEDAFRMRLNRKLSEKSKPSRLHASWFRKPAIAGSAVLLVLFLGWLSTQIFLPSSSGLEETELHIKSTLVRLFTQHGTLLNQDPAPIDTGPGDTAIHEFQWSIKRVIFAIQRENAQNEDIVQNLSRVLHNAAGLINAENGKSGEWNI
jgi:hypothetical protein